MGPHWPVRVAAIEILVVYSGIMTRTKTQKARARAERAAMVKAMSKAQAHRPPKGKSKKWHFAVGTQWGNLSMGSGDSANQLKSGRSARRAREVGDLISQAPAEVTQDRSSKSRRQLICEDEFVAVVYGSTTFACNHWAIQPGLSIYPWLSQVAVLYERYKIKKWKFYFKPTVSQYNALGSQGRIVLSTDYDAATELIQNLQQAEGMSPHSDGLPYQRVELGLDPVRMTEGPNGKFVRDSLPPAGTDVKTYDAGKLFICTEGMSGAGQIGELRVAYEVELLNPRLPNAIQPAINKVASKCSGTATPASAVWTTSNITNFNLDPSVGNGLGLSVDGVGIVMPAGIFWVSACADILNTGGNLLTSSVRMLKNGVPIPGTTRAVVSAATATFGRAEDCVNTESMLVCNNGDVISFQTYNIFPAGATTALMYINVALN